MIEALCVLFGHRWELKRTTDIDFVCGFQPRFFVMANVGDGLADYSVVYEQCKRCGLVRYEPIVRIMVTNKKGEER